MGQRVASYLQLERKNSNFTKFTKFIDEWNWKSKNRTSLRDLNFSLIFNKPYLQISTNSDKVVVSFLSRNNIFPLKHDYILCNVTRCYIITREIFFTTFPTIYNHCI